MSFQNLPILVGNYKGLRCGPAIFVPSRGSLLVEPLELSFEIHLESRFEIPLEIPLKYVLKYLLEYLSNCLLK